MTNRYEFCQQCQSRREVRVDRIYPQWGFCINCSQRVQLTRPTFDAVLEQKFTRRGFGGVAIKGAVLLGTFAAGILTGVAADEAGDWLDRRQTISQMEIEAKRLFQEIFRLTDFDALNRLTHASEMVRKYSLGNEYSPGRYHRDHEGAWKALMHAVGHDLEVETVPIIDSSYDGDLVVLGGPNSTLLTKVVWQFEGPNDRELTRRPDAALRLRYIGISNANEETTIADRRIAWHIEGVGIRSTANWHFEDIWAKEQGKLHRIRPQPGRRVSVNGEDAYIPLDNYLLVTRLPNLLHPDFERLQHLDPSIWPYILVFEGNHGIGTRALELLTRPEGLQALHDVKSNLGRSLTFQLLFRVSEIDDSEGFHKAHKIELVHDGGIVNLDDINPAVYQQVREYAIPRLPHSLTP